MKKQITMTELNMIQTHLDAIYGILGLTVRVTTQEYKAKSKSQLADGLNAKAWELLEKARKGGLVDEEYMPTGSRTEAALLASAIAQDAGISRPWKAFGKLWEINNFRSYSNKAIYLTDYPNLIQRINTILRTEFIQNT